MGYAELYRALDEETGRQIEALREGAARESERLVVAAGQAVAREREEARVERGRRLAADELRRAARARLEEERAALTEMRRLLAELYADVEARLPAPGDAALITRLVDELRPELTGEACQLEVAEADAETVRRVSGGVRVVTRPSGGGVRAIIGPRLLDNTLAGRLRRAWPALEPELAELLFGGAHARP